MPLTETAFAFRGRAPFGFHLDLHVEDLGAGAGVVCEADLNPFMKMMAQKPLEALFQHIAGRVKPNSGRPDSGSGLHPEPPHFSGA